MEICRIYIESISRLYIYLNFFNITNFFKWNFQWNKYLNEIQQISSPRFAKYFLHQLLIYFLCYRFCDRHGPKAAVNKSVAPSDLMCVAEAMMPRIILRLIQHLRENWYVRYTFTTIIINFFNNEFLMDSDFSVIFYRAYMKFVKNLYLVLIFSSNKLIFYNSLHTF